MSKPKNLVLRSYTFFHRKLLREYPSLVKGAGLRTLLCRHSSVRIAPPALTMKKRMGVLGGNSFPPNFIIFYGDSHCYPQNNNDLVKGKNPLNNPSLYFHRYCAKHNTNHSKRQNLLQIKYYSTGRCAIDCE